jgi:hypothetical protein
MFIAGGTAYCRWRMNWYSGSGWMRPSRTAPFTSAVPSSGSRMYLTATTPAITDGGTLAPLRTPVVVNQRVSRVMHACAHACILLLVIRSKVTVQKVCSHDQRDGRNRSSTVQRIINPWKGKD